MSVSVILCRHGIREGYLGIDDTDKKRSKSTKRIVHVHKIKHKLSGRAMSWGNASDVFGFGYPENHRAGGFRLSYAGSGIERMG